MTLNAEGLRTGDNTLAFWVTGPNRGELRSETVPPPSGSEAEVRTLYSGISRGTESLVFTGHVPQGEYERMRAPFQAGQFPAPVKYGYASVGRIVSAAGTTAEVRELAGKIAFCLYPHQQRYVVPTSALHLLPDAVPPKRAVLAANMETALNAVWDSGAGPGDRIAVIGGGSVGCLTAWLASRIPGCGVQLIDVNPGRADVAKALNINFGLPSEANSGADVVIHASGSGEGLALAMHLAAFEATVVELSWYGDKPVTIGLGEAFHSQRLTLKSSQVGTIAASRRARWPHRRRMELALSLLIDPALDVLINSESRFEDLPETMLELTRSPSDTIMHRVSYE